MGESKGPRGRSFQNKSSWLSKQLLSLQMLETPGDLSLTPSPSWLFTTWLLYSAGKFPPLPAKPLWGLGTQTASMGDSPGLLALPERTSLWL